ncbi:MAG: NAD-dependent epimerase/dehydratase family protein [Caldilineaceae bacterium]
MPASVLYPRQYNEVNVGGTVALLEACRDVGVTRVVFASSATVYGEQPEQPVSEAVWPRPVAPYAVSKLAAEQYLFSMGHSNGFETVALRIFNAYGPGQQMPPAHPPVIPQFMHQIMGGGSVIVFGDGTQTRDFVYVDDVVAALIAAATAAQVDREIINVGSGQETALNDLIARIGSVVGAKPSILYNREAGGGVTRLVADISKARRLLAWQPSVELAAGLRKLYEQDPAIRRAISASAYTA